MLLGPHMEFMHSTTEFDEWVWFMGVSVPRFMKVGFVVILVTIIIVFTKNRPHLIALCDAQFLVIMVNEMLQTGR